MYKLLFLFLALLSSLAADEILARYGGKELKYSQVKTLFEESLSSLDLERGIKKRTLILRQFTESYLYHLALLDLAKADGFTLMEKAADPKASLALEQGLLSRWTEAKLMKEVSVSYTEALLYFNEHPKEFWTGATLRLQSYLFLDENSANQFKTDFKKLDFGAVSKKYKAFEKNLVKGSDKFLNQGDLSANQWRVFMDCALNSLISSESSEGYWQHIVVDRNESKKQDFKEVYADLKSFLKRRKIKELSRKKVLKKFKDWSVEILVR